jgi:hypothetical protein
MPKIRYVADLPILKNDAKLAIVHRANAIIDEYRAQGFDLTLRQLYYQFVARGVLANKPQEYKRLGDIIVDGRLAGLIDWDAIVDRTRNLEALPHWDAPADIIEACASQFNLDRWKNQEHRIEVWIEKEALAGVFEGVCRSLDVPYFCCRGYTSISEMWAAGRRLLAYRKTHKQTPIILHFGDHDPSGIDMTRDIVDRLAMFSQGPVTVERLALNRDQIDEYDPPPNPAKLTDSRCAGYIQVHGDESWELDALEPAVLADLVREAVKQYRNEDQWDEDTEAQDSQRHALSQIANRYEDVIAHLGGEDA